MQISKYIIVTVSALLAFQALQIAQAPSTNLEFSKDIARVFETWRIKHNKFYSTPQEKAFRLSVFLKSYIKVKNHKNPSYGVALNKFSDMTLEEVKIKYFGYKKMGGYGSESNIKYLEVNQASDVDWSKKGKVTPVKDQGQCGSCWAFSTTGSLEGVQAIATGNLISFSEQYLVDCAKNGNYGCNGGEMTNALTYVQKNGIPTEKSYPYLAVDRKCQTSVPTVWKNSSWT